MAIVRGQASAELISIMGISLLVVLIFSLLAAQAFTGIGLQQNYNEAYESVQALASAADAVHAQGEGATKIVTIKIPPNAVFGSSQTYIGRPSGSPDSVSSKEIAIRLDNNSVFSTSSVRLSGLLPSAPGQYRMKVTARAGYVSIYPHLIELDRNSLSIIMAQGESRTAIIKVNSAGSSPVPVNTNSSWSFPGINVSVSPFLLNASVSGSPLTLVFNSSPDASGFHNFQLLLNATASGGTEEVVSLPISVNVLSG